jgi:hypothetical protein
MAAELSARQPGRELDSLGWQRLDDDETDDELERMCWAEPGLAVMRAPRPAWATALVCGAGKRPLGEQSCFGADDRQESVSVSVCLSNGCVCRSKRVFSWALAGRRLAGSREGWRRDVMRDGSRTRASW